MKTKFFVLVLLSLMVLNMLSACSIFTFEGRVTGKNIVIKDSNNITFLITVKNKSGNTRDCAVDSFKYKVVNEGDYVGCIDNGVDTDPISTKLELCFFAFLAYLLFGCICVVAYNETNNSANELSFSIFLAWPIYLIIILVVLVFIIPIQFVIEKIKRK